MRHLNRNLHRRTELKREKFQTEIVPKGSDDKSKISKPSKVRSGLPSKRPTAPIDTAELSRQLHQGLKDALNRENADGMVLVEDTTRGIKK